MDVTRYRVDRRGRLEILTVSFSNGRDVRIPFLSHPNDIAEANESDWTDELAMLETEIRHHSSGERKILWIAALVLAIVIVIGSQNLSAGICAVLGYALFAYIVVRRWRLDEEARIIREKEWSTFAMICKRLFHYSRARNLEGAKGYVEDLVERWRKGGSS